MSSRSPGVFISYRRALAQELACQVFSNLTEHGYDVFMDAERVDDGGLEGAVGEQIASRQHFLVILAPKTSFGAEPVEQDRMRQEFAHAVSWNRNIVPVMAEGFDNHELDRLPADIAPLANRTGLRIYAEYFDAAMERLRERFLWRAHSGTPGQRPPRPPRAPTTLSKRAGRGRASLGATAATAATALRRFGAFAAGLLFTFGASLAASTGRLARRAASFAASAATALIVSTIVFAGVLFTSGTISGGVTPPSQDAFTTTLDPGFYLGRPTNEVRGELHRVGFGTEVRSVVGPPPTDESACVVVRVVPSGEVLRWSKITLTCR
jgi:hypothetical protein